ncbi:Ubiquitin conjugation factor E4 [Golovinomyces cichoracearum]|uniref:Ubiquitin conjugation factor E4 n=1 Tax=Golovinomyces cichoracearum TaxID=62708 RepID=A0A420IZL1_9PEZI|nr:Ubiquitin conjugation factor E4 [Golovinomyces cichoracearum]
MDGNPPSTDRASDILDKEKIDQIRKRRLEKLGGTSTKNLVGSDDSNSPPVPTTSKPEVSSILPSKLENPFAKLAQNGATKTPITRQKPKKIPIGETIEEYEDRILCSSFCITLDASKKPQFPNHTPCFLANLRQDLESENVPILLTRERLESAILEAASAVPSNKSILNYLIPCFKRITKIMTGLGESNDAKLAILKEAERLCLSYCIFAVDVPDLFGRTPNPAYDSLAHNLILDSSVEESADHFFITKIASRIEEDESVKPLLVRAAIDLSQQLSEMTMNNNYKRYVNALNILCQDNRVITAISQHHSFYSNDEPPQTIEKNTFLGPFFRISPLQPEISLEYFSNVRSMSTGMINTAQETLRLTGQAHQRDLQEIINLFVRASAESRNRTLDWFAYILNSNQKRRALRPDPTTLSTDGFLINITAVLDELCSPFMDLTFSKIDKIDLNYFRKNPRIDIKEETKLNADQDASNNYFNVTLEGSSNFISEVFFLTMAAHHYGSGGTISMLKSLGKDIEYLEQKISQIELERPKIAHNPQHLARFEEQLKRFRDILDKSCSLKYACEAVLFDKVMQSKSLTYMSYVTVWLIRLASRTDYVPYKNIALPLAPDIPDAFRYLPEYALENVVSSFIFMFRYIPDITISAVGEELIVLCVTFLISSDYIKNPYLKANLVSLLFFGTWPIYNRAKGVIGDALIGSKFANDNLLHALMKFYIDVESTGAHTQFYDKFNIRYEIFQVIKCIWANDIYQQRLVQESKTNIEFFLRFVNLLLNDATYVLDEALTKLPKIHDLQYELRNSTSLSDEQRSSKEEELHAAESQAQSYMQLTNETVSMMKLFTKSLSVSFTMPEIVDRVAAMLDYTLDILVGPKSTNLKVDDMKKFQFEPRTLLSKFVDIYLNLGVSEEFIRAVAQDGRSYKPANFDAASRILTRYSLKSTDEIVAWDRLKSKFIRAKEQDDQDEEDFGDIPDEFMDPLLACLMKDPVLLPRSQQILDRSTIRSHLLSDPNDPFIRQPLKIEDVIELPELKAKILKWKQEVKSKSLRHEKNIMDVSDT